MLERGKEGGRSLGPNVPNGGKYPHQQLFFLYSLFSEREESNEVLNYIKPFNFLCFLIHLLSSETVDT